MPKYSVPYWILGTIEVDVDNKQAAADHVGSDLSDEVLIQNLNRRNGKIEGDNVIIETRDIHLVKDIESGAL